MPFKTCGPDEILVVSGLGHSEPLLLRGGRKFVWSKFQKIQRLSLNLMTIMIHSPRIYTKLGVPLSATGVAQVKIISNIEEKLKIACTIFLDMKPERISEIAKETLEGHQRAIMGLMTVEEIYMDRTKFAKSVFEVASRDLFQMGLSVVSYTIKELDDDEGYLKCLGMSRTSQVKRDARMGEADARRDGAIRQAAALKLETIAQIENKTKIASAERDFSIRKAEYEKEVKTRQAQTDLAYQLQAAITKQQIKEEEMQIKVIEREQMINVQELEIQRRERELEATVRKRAEAEQYRMEKIAYAEKQKAIREAEALAESIKLKGDAEAYAILEMAKAESEQMTKKSEAWKEYTAAAKLDMFLKALPKLASEIAQPLMSVSKVTMVSNGDSNIGISKMSEEILSLMDKIPKLIGNMTGIDLLEKALKE